MSAVKSAGENMTFAARMALAAEDIGRLEKDGYNKFHDYEYVTEASVKAAVGPALRRAGLYIASVQHQFLPAPGSDFTHVLCATTVTVSDGVSSASAAAIGSGTDKGDKAAYKAMAGGLKYALTSLFLIATGDDAEADEATDKPAAKKEPAPKAEPKKPAARAKPEPKAEAAEEAEKPSATASTNAELKALGIVEKIADVAGINKATGELAELRPLLTDKGFENVKAAFKAKREAIAAAAK